ncbi:MAG: division/cell wall cluster transcriptional repressor MraZ, partial [Salinivirgaceae bacterium]|nr:division/cell wall cluster transcriptional repressor MraZ [Salinivirgaceae bacterium]
TFDMANFIGDYNCKVDAKGRILFPAGLKKQLDADGNCFVIKKDLFEQCLVMYTSKEWERQNEIIRSQINPFNKEHNRFLRGFYRGTAEIELDNNGRLLLPKRLLDEAGIDKDIVLSGQDTKIELWSESKYNAMAEDENEFAALAEKIMIGSSNAGV